MSGNICCTDICVSNVKTTDHFLIVESFSTCLSFHVFPNRANVLNDVSTQNVLEGRSVKLYYAVVLLLTVGEVVRSMFRY